MTVGRRFEIAELRSDLENRHLCWCSGEAKFEFEAPVDTAFDHTSRRGTGVHSRTDTAAFRSMDKEGGGRGSPPPEEKGGGGKGTTWSAGGIGCGPDDPSSMRLIRCCHHFPTAAPARRSLALPAGRMRSLAPLNSGGSRGDCRGSFWVSLIQLQRAACTAPSRSGGSGSRTQIGLYP